MEDKKLVMNRPTATTCRIDYMGGRLSVADKAMHRLFSEDIQIKIDKVTVRIFLLKPLLLIQ